MEELYEILNELVPGADFRNNKRLVDDKVLTSLNLLKLVAKLISIYKVAVVSKRHSSFIVIYEDRLSIKAGIGSGRAVTHMTYRHIALSQSVKAFGSEHIVHKTGVLVGIENAVIVHNDAAAFLSSVL